MTVAESAQGVCNGSRTTEKSGGEPTFRKPLGNKDQVMENEAAWSERERENEREKCHGLYGQQNNDPHDVRVLISGPVDILPHMAKEALQMGLN